MESSCKTSNENSVICGCGNTHMKEHIFPLFSSPPFVAATLTLSNSSLCSALLKQAPLPITEKRFLAPSISVSDHPSTSILTALKTDRFSAQQASQAKPSQSSNCLLAIPAFDRKAGLNDRHLNSNRGICLR